MAANDNRRRSILGIDIGTTTVKVALIEETSGVVITTNSRETQATVHSDLGSQGNEQDPSKILTSLQICLAGIQEYLRSVTCIAVSGQMHGVMFWKHGEGWKQRNRKQNSYGRYDLDIISPLYTWQDGRCSAEMLASLPKPDSHLRLSSGFGCATIFWLQRNKPEFLAKYDRAGTIQDFLVTMLCDLNSAVMSIHNAASWGYYNTAEQFWNVDMLQYAGFPVHYLPRVQEAGTIAGVLQSAWYGIPQGTPVAAALGDAQCSIISCMEKPDDAVLNISTSAQLAVQMPADFVPRALETAVEYFPYFNGRYLAVAASLTGGNAMAHFIKMLQQWTHELGLGIPESKIWETVMRMGDECDDTDLQISPTIFGERHLPSERGTVSNITALNISLGSVFCAISKGIIVNIHQMMSRDNLLEAGIKRIVGSGTGLLKNTRIQKAIEEVYDLPLVLHQGSGADAAIGAAMALHRTLANLKSETIDS